MIRINGRNWGVGRRTILRVMRKSEVRSVVTTKKRVLIARKIRGDKFLLQLDWNYPIKARSKMIMIARTLVSSELSNYRCEISIGVIKEKEMSLCAYYVKIHPLLSFRFLERKQNPFADPLSIIISRIIQKMSRTYKTLIHYCRFVARVRINRIKYGENPSWNGMVIQNCQLIETKFLSM